MYEYLDPVTAVVTEITDTVINVKILDENGTEAVMFRGYNLPLGSVIKGSVKDNRTTEKRRMVLRFESVQNYAPC